MNLPRIFQFFASVVGEQGSRPAAAAVVLAQGE
jgi:hypothetical protein